MERGGADVARHAVLDGVGVEVGGPTVEQGVRRGLDRLFQCLFLVDRRFIGFRRCFAARVRQSANGD